MSEVMVHVHYRRGEGAYLGHYDFWTLLLGTPIEGLRAGVWAVAVHLAWTLAVHAVKLLKGAKTQSKRVDIIVPFSNGAKVVTRIILVEVRLPSSESVKVPSKRGVYALIVAAIEKLQVESGREPHKAQSVIAELKIHTDKAFPLRIRVYEEQVLEAQVADAKSVKPIALPEEPSKKTTRKKTPKKSGSVSLRIRRSK
jgi:hypothetical protein